MSSLDGSVELLSRAFVRRKPRGMALEINILPQASWQFGEGYSSSDWVPLLPDQQLFFSLFYLTPL